MEPLVTNLPAYFVVARQSGIGQLDIRYNEGNAKHKKI